MRYIFELGIDFDTARGYTEEKVEAALKHVRDEVVIATKSPGKEPQETPPELASDKVQ